MTMKKVLLAVALGATAFVVSCATDEPTMAPVVQAAATGPTAVPGTTATATTPSPSLKDTARQDRELGDSVIPYPFDNCAVIQKPFGAAGPKFRRVYQGYEVLFCCTPCLRAFDANPEPFMPRIKEAVAAKAAVGSGQ